MPSKGSKSSKVRAPCCTGRRRLPASSTSSRPHRSATARRWSGSWGERGLRSDGRPRRSRTDDFSMVMAGKYLKKAEWQTPYTFHSGADVFSVSHTIPSDAAGTYIGARYKNLTVMTSVDQSTSSYFIPPFQVTGDARWRQLFADAGYVLAVRDTLDDELQRHVQPVAVRRHRRNIPQHHEKLARAPRRVDELRQAVREVQSRRRRHCGRHQRPGSDHRHTGDRRV